MGSVEQLPAERAPYSGPEAISADHRLELFDCGKTPLNDWLRRRAFKNEGKTSRTYVVNSRVGEDAGAVVGFYSLAAGAVRLRELPSKLARNMPNPVPVMVLGRMAVDERHKGRGLGRAMLKEALQRTLETAQKVGVRAVIVHAIDEDAVTFYTRYKFQEFPVGSRTLFLPVETIADAI